MTEFQIKISQSVAILVDGNNIERSAQTQTQNPNSMLNFDKCIPRLLAERGLSRLIYFREGKGISSKLAERLHNHYHGSVVPCYKSADIPLSIKATQLASKVDTIIILSGDSDYVELVRHLKGEGVRVEIAAVEANTAAILKEEADYFHPITLDDIFTLQASSGRSTSTNKQTSAPTGRKTTAKRQSPSSNQQSSPAKRQQTTSANRQATPSSRQSPPAKRQATPAKRPTSKSPAMSSTKRKTSTVKVSTKKPSAVKKSPTKRRAVAKR